jgi:hypothetical protein
MSYVMFPKEPFQLAAMEKSLQNADLMQVHQTVEQLTDLSGKTGVTTVFSSNLFEAAMKRTEELGNHEICLNHEICRLLEEMNNLIIEKTWLTPDQFAQKLGELQNKIFSCSQPNTQSLKQGLRLLENQWNHLYFLYTFPMAEELNPDSFISNYFHRTRERTEQMQLTDPVQASQLQAMLKDLQRECFAAEQVFCGKGDRLYSRLSPDVQTAVQQRLFAHDPILLMNQRQNPEILAAAIMADLADRMMD